MRQGLCHNIALKPLAGGRKIAIIDQADYLNLEGANCLLKTLEEPELERRFGTSYREYKRRVPMFVPTVRGIIKGKRRVV